MRWDFAVEAVGRKLGQPLYVAALVETLMTAAYYLAIYEVTAEPE